MLSRMNLKHEPNGEVLSMANPSFASPLCMPSIFSQALHQKGTIHQVITMLATSKSVLFPGHNNLLTTGVDDSTL